MAVSGSRVPGPSPPTSLAEGEGVILNLPLGRADQDVTFNCPRAQGLRTLNPIPTVTICTLSG
jgi:hypothetical protein